MERKNLRGIDDKRLRTDNDIFTITKISRPDNHKDIAVSEDTTFIDQGSSYASESYTETISEELVSSY